MVDKMASSGDVHILKTTSRLIGLITLGLSFLLVDNLYWVAGLFAASMAVTDTVFMLLGKKESKYKDPHFFINNHIMPKNLDRYTMTMNILRAVLLAPLFFYGQLHWYVFFCAFAPLLISCLTGYKPYMPDGSLTTDKPWYEGVPGYDMSGNCTGSPTAIGGMSN